jgi:uncharacterized protein YjiS (DUF1127 family)
MNDNTHVLPIAGSTVVRTFLTVLAFVTRWLKDVARARRHRREIAALAGLDRRMLADISISHADLRDAFSQPFWKDPSELLRERACERRASRNPAHRPPTSSVERAFRRAEPIWKSCPVGGRPEIDKEVRDLIRRMSFENASGVRRTSAAN